uniref:hypothetical protein n=1 Tax=Campylobacter jejuni TaxID=197 RepID=UPI001E64F0F1
NGQCYKDVVIYGNVVADEQAERPNSHHNSNRKSSKGKQYYGKNDKYTQCAMKRIQVIERDGKDCFSLHPQLECSSQCRPQGSVEKQVEFVCLQPSSTTQHFKSLIRQGTNPDFSQKKPVQSFRINVPESCNKSSY